MNLKIVYFVLILISSGAVTTYSQTYKSPNISIRSHETLEISKIEITPQTTVIFLNLENRITGGYFCADKNIFIVYPDGTRSKLITSEGIPVCPDTYKFKTIGEKLSFKLTFTTLKQDVEWVDLLEDCQENCFSFYGVCLSNDLNSKIDDASVLAENNEPAKALISFMKIADTLDSKSSGIEGLIYISIITLAKETGNISKSAEWYRKLASSSVPRRELYIKHLNSQGIIY